jgi:hypothetical protein
MKKNFKKNFILHNYSFFNNCLKKKSNKIFLVEFNGWPFIHIIFSYLINYYKSEKKCKIVAYESFEILNRVKQNIFKKFFWLVGSKLSLKTFNIFKSMGVDSFIRPKYSNHINIKAKKLFIKYSKNLTHSKLENLMIEKIWIGDLIYDSYLKKYNLSTIKNFKDKNFVNFFYDSIRFYLFWYNFIKKNKIEAICGCHEVYLTGIPLRIASYFGIKTLAISNLNVFNITNKINFKKKTNSEFYKSKNINNYLKKEISKLGKNKIIYLGKKIVNNFLSGNNRIFYMKKNYYQKKIFLNQKYDKREIKIVIFSHNFSDSFHTLGNGFFEDYRKWFDFLEKIIIKTNYKWFLKIHPSSDILTINEINRFLKRTNKVNIISSSFPNNELSNIGIKYGLTLYGTVSSELPYYGITMINGMKNNPHHSFNFSYTPKNLKDYKKKLLNLGNFNFKINYDELYHFSYIKDKFINNNIFFDDINRITSFKNGKFIQYTDEMYKIWLKNFNLQKHHQIKRKINNFLVSNRYSIQ